MTGSRPHPPRLDAVGKVTGATGYTADTLPRGCLHLRLVRSNRAHAEILDLDASPALQVPNVLTVLTGDDVAALVTARVGHAIRDRPVLADGRVRYYGEPLAIVVATTAQAAAAGAAAVRVAYRDLPRVVHAQEALATDAPVLHGDRDRSQLDVNVRSYEGGGASGDQTARHPNVIYEVTREWGDVDAVREEAATVVRTCSRYPALHPYTMEPYCCWATWDGRVLSVVSPTQHPFLVQAELAELFHLPRSRVRVTTAAIGGAFGAKAYTQLEPLVALAARRCRRPVALVLDAEESMYVGRTPEVDCEMATGFAADGRILFREAQLLLDGGAYAGNVPLILTKTVNRSVGPYRIPHLRIRGVAAYTNKVPAVSYRGFGATYGNVAGETALERGADALGLDPLEVRRRNLLCRGEEVLPGRRPLDADLLEHLDRLADALGDVRSDAENARGVGLAMSLSDAGALPTSSSEVRLLADGSVLVQVGATELGQGSHTVLALLAAERVGVPPDLVHVSMPDTHGSSWERTTGASRTTALVGRAVVAACDDAVARVRHLTARLLGCAEEEVRWEGGGVVVAGRRIALRELLVRWFGTDVAEIRGVGSIRATDDLELLPALWEVGAVGVAVAVDRLTGVVSVERLVTSADVGQAVHPTLVRGQELGAALQGLGGALFEEVVVEAGQIVNSNLVDYRVPRASDLPEDVRSSVVADGAGVGPRGAKGVGEGALNPVAAAIVIAVARATGRWHEVLPLRPERVWAALPMTTGELRAAPLEAT